MGMLLQRVLKNGMEILSETTRGVTTTQVKNSAGELISTRIKRVSVSKMPKEKVVGFRVQKTKEADTIRTVEKKVKDEESNIISSRRDSIYTEDGRLLARRFREEDSRFDTAYKTIDVFKDGQISYSKRTDFKSGIRTYEEISYGNQEELYNKLFDIKDEIRLLECKAGEHIRTEISPLLTRGEKRRLNNLKHQRKILNAELRSLRERGDVRCFTPSGIPEEFEHLDRAGLLFNA